MSVFTCYLDACVTSFLHMCVQARHTSEGQRCQLSGYSEGITRFCGELSVNLVACRFQHFCPVIFYFRQQQDEEEAEPQSKRSRQRRCSSSSSQNPTRRRLSFLYQIYFYTASQFGPKLTDIKVSYCFILIIYIYSSFLGKSHLDSDPQFVSLHVLLLFIFLFFLVLFININEIMSLTITL